MSGANLMLDATNTKERLLQAALKAFGHNDFNTVSIREIADISGANISAISYHFGGKQGLYLATAEYLADGIQAKMRPLLDNIRDRLESANVEECRELMRQLIHALVHNLIFGEIGEHAAGLIFREQNHPTAAFDILYKKLMLPLHTVFSLLVARITAADPEAKHTVLLTHSLLGQILIYRMGRETIMRRLGTNKFSAADANEIAEVISALSLKALGSEG